MNIPESIKQRIGRNLHNQKNHPLCIIKEMIYEYFGPDYKRFDDMKPDVPTKANFDQLLIPKDHPARSLSDTYYVTEDTVLRTHTSAHQNELMSAGFHQFLVTGDVYRKDDIDATHYPVFHQMEGVYITTDDVDIEEHLKVTLAGLITVLFPGCEWRWHEDYFPFTEPSYEVEVQYEGKWLEVLGCGVIHRQIMENNSLSYAKGWAFGLGLERLAMILFKIPDIRLFWSQDERFLSQFKSGTSIEFQPFSKYPPIERDIAFWIDENFIPNDFSEMVRDYGQDLVENLSMFDTFKHPKTGRESKAYRIVYRSNERTLTNEEINEIQDKIRNEAVRRFKVEVR
jgi:phenylalanyl-tRNA synthetase alpha chain